MPDNDKAVSPGGARPTDEQRQFLEKLLRDVEQRPAAAVPKGEDYFDRRATLRIPQGNCIRCHDTGHRELEFKPLDLGAFGRPPAWEKAESPAPSEKHLVDKFHRQSEMEKAITVFSRLPEKASIKFADHKLSLQTDFRKFIEAIPGVHADSQSAAILSNISSLSLDRDKFSAALKKPLAVDAGDHKMDIGTAADPNLRFDLKLGQDGDFSMTGIQGLKIDGVNVDQLTMRTVDGKPLLTVAGHMTRTILNREVSTPSLPWTVPAQDVFKGLDIGLLRGIVGTLSEAKTVLQARDLGKYADLIPEDGLRHTLKTMFKGIARVEKDGDKLTIMRDNGLVTHDLNGSKLVFRPQISFRVGHSADMPALTDINGFYFEMPLPEQLGLGSRYATDIKGLRLGYADQSGNRDLAVDTNHLIDSVRVRLNKQFQPVTDGAGNWQANFRGHNPLSADNRDKLDVRLRFGRDGQPNMTSGELADIAARMSWQAADFSRAGAGLAVGAALTKLYGWLFD